MIREWNDIVKHYEDAARDNPSLAGIRDLSMHIANGPLQVSLYGWTSMFDLCITQTKVTYPYSGPLLRISPLQNGNIEFRHEDTAIRARQWNREVQQNETVANLHKFLGQLHWLAS